MRTVLERAGGAAIAAVLWPFGSQAADEAAQPPSEPIYLNQLTITATRNPLPAFDTPGMVTVIERDEIEMLQPSAVDDILKFVPGVEFFGGPRRTGEVPSIRGFAGADVIILLDGARQNFGSAHDGRFFLDPELLREVEVLRGASSSLYGSGGTGGVIEFRTATAGDFLEADESYGVRSSVGYQDVNEEELGSLTAYAQPGYGLDLIANITYRDSDDISLGGGETLSNSDDNILSGMAKAGSFFGAGHFAEASFIGYNGDIEEPNNAQGIGSADSVDKDIRSQTFRLAYGYANPANPWLNLDAVAYYTSTSADEQRLDNLGAGPAGELLTRDVDTVGFRVDNRSMLSLGEKAQTLFTYGIEYYRDDQDGERDGAPRDGVPNAESDTFGAFAQAELTFSDLGPVPGEMLLVPGVRFDFYDIDSDVAEGTTETEVSPRIAATYKPLPWLMGFASYGEAFRAPTFNELFLTGTHFQIPIGPVPVTNFFVPNPDLKPQKTRTVEFGGGVQFDNVLDDGDRFQAKASYFTVKGEDFIALDVMQPTPFVDCNPFTPGACNGTTIARNVADAKLHGFELESGYESRRFRASLGLSTIDAEDEQTGEPIGLLAPTQVTAGFAVKLPEISSIVGWRGIFAAEFDNTTDPAEERDAYQVHSIFAAYEADEGPLKGLRLDVGADNLFDAEFSRTFTGADEPGRNFKAKISYKLNF